MINVLKSDFYKLFLRKSFYICGIIAGAFGVLLVVLINNLYPNAKDFGYSGINSIGVGIGQITLLTTIFLSMFIPSEFAFGTIKNMASRGINRASIYFSKLTIGIFTSVVYTIFVSLCGFIAGSIMWGVGEFKSDEGLQLLEMFGLFILAEICLQSVFIMIGFLVRHMGGTVAINLGIYMIISQVIFPIINYAVKTLPWLGYEIDSAEYWVGTYAQIFTAVNIEQDIVNKGIIVCLVYLILSTAIGILDFCRRDV